MEDKAIELSLIPFGLRENDGEFVDIADVPRGKQCGCVCPSCKTPLIARQGDVKEWHFAHASHSVYSRTEKECQFSFYVSVRMMARQVIREKLELVLPRYEDVVSEYHESSCSKISIPFVVTEQRKIILTEVEVEKTFTGPSVDIVGKVADFYFVIYFSHPGRSVPITLFNPADKKCGIISISLEPVARLFSQSKDNKESYHEVLQNFLTNHVESKRWLFHPRYEHCENEAKQKLEKGKGHIEKEAVKNIDMKNVTISSVPVDTGDNNKLGNYQCVICHTSWQASNRGGNVCPKCDTHLYVSFKGYAENKT
ncbi:MAG: competence protein CoiA [Methylococcales symbiont of Hymedesmia sp. n. MRB-2018]|nr:MAG: competence protein CoiA [Methylococcales symbiont of Hymedesmia sp. n. MRB-2018]